MTPLLAAILTGLVVDQNGAYITNATVQYLPAGIYGLRISAPGFFIGRISPMPLAADDVKELPPITLRVGFEESNFYCGMKFSAPRYTRTPAPEASLRGRISTPATITLTGGARPLTIEAEGSFRFDGLTPGTYTLRATSPEYPTVEIDGGIDPPETRKTLQPSKATAICL